MKIVITRLIIKLGVLRPPGDSGLRVRKLSIVPLYVKRKKTVIFTWITIEKDWII